MNTNMSSYLCAPFLMVCVLSMVSCGDSMQDEEIQAKRWEECIIEFAGPQTAEDATPNPFLDYRLVVTFSSGTQTLKVPGYYAADGKASESGASAGNIWRVHFLPIEAGEWSYEVSFRQGDQIAMSDDESAGEATAFNGQSGKIMVEEASADAKGKLLVSGGRYLQYAGSGAHFLKSGADSPENLLGYEDFDGTHRGTDAENREGEAAVKKLHTFQPHIKDWRAGDPTWGDGKGKGLIGGLNYLADKGVNSVYFLTMNIGGDGKDVWPYTGYDERYRFDCSKLDQWEIVFDHMDDLGLMLHVVLQETENERLLDAGNTGPQRKLYLRELIARFAHHQAITWNMGEENGPASFSPNGQTTEQQKAMFSYIKATDPYNNFTVVHSHSNPHHRDSLFALLLGFEDMDGMSVQTHDPANSHEITLKWLAESKRAGNQWVVNLDEIGPASIGMDPDDKPNNNQDTVRGEVLWGNLMAGGGGTEWYFGYKNHNNDLECEDWRSRDRVWDFTYNAINFFHTYLPFSEMNASNDLVSGTRGYCFVKPNDIYAVYLLHGGQASIDLSAAEGTYSVQWYNPRAGGALQNGNVTEIEGGAKRALGASPEDPEKDWAILIKKKS
ncbi:MAG: DUF5060 domain-containing protein [Saprospiraceae bacterium]|nr:DUF5060 domain-containing protein [Saprospiraceae bacterium]